MTMPRPHAYAPLAGFAAPARPRAELWRSLVGVGLIALGYFAGITVLAYALVAVLKPFLGNWAATSFVAGFVAGRSAPGLTLLLYSFALLALPALIVARWLHRRGMQSLVGPWRRALGDAVRVALPIVALAVVMLPFTVLADHTGRSLPFATWLAWLPVALPGLAVQVGAEELVFRGYLQQQLAARFQSPLAWMVLPSALFAVMHYAPGTWGGSAWLIVLWAGLFGCLAADLTARTGTLGAAFGLHLATNFAAIFLVGLWGDLDGLSLWNVVINTRDPAALLPMLLIDLVSLVVSWLLARLMLRV